MQFNDQNTAASNNYPAWTTNRRVNRPTATDVIITIDAEIAPHSSDWKQDGGRVAFNRDIFGCTPAGDRGLAYQLEHFERHGLKCVVFVEALHAGVLGFEPLEEIVRLVRATESEVALHLHTEWLSFYDKPLLGDRLGRNMREFSEEDQYRLIETGLQNLARCGADDVIAVRAGNAGADRATLRAARRAGLQVDSSHFAVDLGNHCRLESEPTLSQPTYIDGVLEVPIGWYRDGLGRLRPAQLCASSTAEMEHFLWESRRRGWKTAALLLHSFELLRRRSPRREQGISRLHEARFQWLCRFLAAYRDEFPTATFHDIIAKTTTNVESGPCLRAPLAMSMRRYVEQVVGRIL